MIALAFAFMLVVMGAIMLMSRAMLQQRERLELALEPTCLLCDSRRLELGVPPEYTCADCGFDTHKAGMLTTELERYRELTHAMTELEIALRELDEATRANAVGRIPQAAEPLARGLDHLRDVVLDELELLEFPQPEANEKEVAHLTEYVRLVRGIRDDARHDILARLSADGAVERQALDFEHVVANDYHEL